uniref:Uncharacterized protein LOC116947799 n=1 Tax=Petromyzon marinus TaxID=7757 RepID=A0AAJ7X3M7_PETMA|nr:uncharacterized protein LOC116947799 [Petromyzon marinus]
MVAHTRSLLMALCAVALATAQGPPQVISGRAPSGNAPSGSTPPAPPSPPHQQQLPANGQHAMDALHQMMNLGQGVQFTDLNAMLKHHAEAMSQLLQTGSLPCPPPAMWDFASAHLQRCAQGGGPSMPIQMNLGQRAQTLDINAMLQHHAAAMSQLLQTGSLPCPPPAMWAFASAHLQRCTRGGGPSMPIQQLLVRGFPLFSPPQIPIHFPNIPMMPLDPNIPPMPNMNLRFRRSPIRGAGLDSVSPRPDNQGGPKQEGPKQEKPKNPISDKGGLGDHMHPIPA